MKQKYDYNNLPVSAVYKPLCEKAINRLSRRIRHFDEYLPGNLIAEQEQEIEGYRSRICYLEKELKEKQNEESIQVELVAEGIIADDGVLHLNKGDTLILKADHALTHDIADSIVDKCKQHGIDCIILHRSIEIAGVIEGNRLAEC